jgi:hypothetical protein
MLPCYYICLKFNSFFLDKHLLLSIAVLVVLEELLDDDDDDKRLARQVEMAAVGVD